MRRIPELNPQHSTGQDMGFPRDRGGEAAVSAARTDTFLGERYRRIARRRGKKRAIVAVGRSILVIIGALLSDQKAQFIDLGPDYYASRANSERKVRNHVRELRALGYTVTLNPAA